MKIFINCECLILQKTLEIFLKQFSVDENLADFMITDEKNNKNLPTFYIKQDLKFPFKKSELFDELSKFYEKKDDRTHNFEEKIINLIDNFKEDLLKILKEEYVKSKN